MTGGFTPQYKSLQTLYTRFKERGFEILVLDRKGNVVARFDSKDDPLGDKIPRVLSSILDQ